MVVEPENLEPAAGHVTKGAVSRETVDDWQLLRTAGGSLESCDLRPRQEEAPPTARLLRRLAPPTDGSSEPMTEQGSTDTHAGRGRLRGDGDISLAERWRGGSEPKRLYTGGGGGGRRGEAKNNQLLGGSSPKAVVRTADGWLSQKASQRREEAS